MGEQLIGFFPVIKETSKSRNKQMAFGWYYLSCVICASLIDDAVSANSIIRKHIMNKGLKIAFILRPSGCRRHADGITE